MSAISTHASDFCQTIHQATMEYYVVLWLVSWESLTRLNLLFQCHISTHPQAEGWTFQEIAFYSWLFLNSKGIIDHLFDNLWAGQRLVREGEFDKYLTLVLSTSFHILVDLSD